MVHPGHNDCQSARPASHGAQSSKFSPWCCQVTSLYPSLLKGESAWAVAWRPRRSNGEPCPCCNSAVPAVPSVGESACDTFSNSDARLDGFGLVCWFSAPPQLDVQQEINQEDTRVDPHHIDVLPQFLCDVFCLLSKFEP